MKNAVFCVLFHAVGVRSIKDRFVRCHGSRQDSFHDNLNVAPGLEKSAAIRPFATKKTRLASENILLVDSLANESSCFADRLATKLFFKAGSADADRTWSRKVRGSLCRPKMQGSWPFGPVDCVCQ